MHRSPTSGEVAELVAELEVARDTIECASMSDLLICEVDLGIDFDLVTDLVARADDAISKAIYVVTGQAL